MINFWLRRSSQLHNLDNLDKSIKRNLGLRGRNFYPIKYLLSLADNATHLRKQFSGRDSDLLKSLKLHSISEELDFEDIGKMRLFTSEHMVSLTVLVGC